MLSSAFFTIIITSSLKIDPMPGDYDPSVAVPLSTAEIVAWSEAPEGSELRQDLANGAQFFKSQAPHMQTGGTTPWWDEWQGVDEMSYEWDATLGTPAVDDCSQIRLHQLGMLNDTFKSDLRNPNSYPRVSNNGEIFILVLGADFRWQKLLPLPSLSPRRQ